MKKTKQANQRVQTIALRAQSDPIRSHDKMKLPEKDIRDLRKRTSRLACVVPMIVIPLVIVMNLAVAIINFTLSARIAETLGLSFIQIIEKWIEGISVSKEYSGIFLKAVERWETGLLQLTVAFFILLFFVFWLQRVGREKRILQFIEEHTH
ncbi:MAG: hypothetical protein PHW60_14905 [Kiritimatiellae bacterium]|nr:hypothetical protein [Kiritimatiellia bacterium]